jgi:hypothetical protein
MTRDDIIRKARVAGFAMENSASIQAAGRFAALVAAAEREACAKECEAQIKTFLSTSYATNQPMSSFKERFACTTCAAFIRARGKQ